MELSKDIIKRLKDLGFTQEEIYELDRLSNVYDQNGLYKKIGSINNNILGIDIRPVKIDIDNIEKRMSVDKQATPSKIIEEYKREEMVMNGGATSSQATHYNLLALELWRYGIDATPEQLYELYNTNDIHASMLDDIIAWFRRYFYYTDERDEEYRNLANEILSNYKGIDLETGEVIDTNNG